MPTNDYSKNIVYLSKEQYQELITNETLTVNGQTIIYNDNDIYVTPQAEPITDVKLAGTSIGSNGVANIPVASTSTLGISKINTAYGITISNGALMTFPPNDTQIKTSYGGYLPLTAAQTPKIAFYGLANASGDTTQSESSNALGIYTDTAKQKIQNMLGITNLISTEESSTATATHALNSTFMMNGKLHRATAAIAIGDAVEVGTNCEVVKVDEVFVKKTDYASTSQAGIARVNSDYGTGVYAAGRQTLFVVGANETEIQQGSQYYKPIMPYRQHYSIFYGLSKVAGVDLANETVTLGTYPETSKTAIRSLIGAAAASDIPNVPVQDVQVNSTSVLDGQGVANIPIASTSVPGVAKVNINYGTSIYNGQLQTALASASSIKAGTQYYQPIVPYYQDHAVFYGLAKAAGADEKDSVLSVGTYTETAKSAIRTMLGATSSNVIAVQDEQPTDSDTKVWLPETEAQGIQVPTMEDMNTALAGKVSDVQIDGTSVVTNGIASIPLGGYGTYGVMKIHTNPGNNGLRMNNNELQIYPALDNDFKTKNSARPITPDKAHFAAFYGLATAAGDTTQSISTNAVGTYTDDAKAAIQTMLGVPGDVQVNGTSVVSNGVANIPLASTNDPGVVKVSANNGTQIINGVITTYNASDAEIKAGNSGYKILSATNQHKSVFYGLAKAAGDTTQSASSNAVGTYTSEAKAAIHTMLGIDPASIAAQVDIPLVETVSGTTPTITGQPNVRYVCGEVSTISITPPASGSVDVIFESGSTATTMTVPSTVKWPAWFDAETLEANTTYEVLITDGIYGSVMTWAT